MRDFRQFKELHNERYCWLDLADVQAVFIAAAGRGSRLLLAGGASYDVEEEPDKVLSLLAQAGHCVPNVIKLTEQGEPISINK